MPTSPGTVVGRISVRVLPDTTKFKDKARVELERIEKQLKVKLPTTLDLTGAKREMIEQIRKINAENKAMNSRKIRLQTSIDPSGSRKVIADAIRNLNDQAKGRKLKIRLDAVATTLKADLDKRSLDRIEKELKDWRDRMSPLDVEIRPSMLTGASSYATARLEYLTRPRVVPIIPVLNNAAAAKVAAGLAALAGVRVLNDLFDDLWDRLKRLDKAVPIIGTLAEAIAGLAGYGLSAASNLFTLSSSLAQIGQAGLALPGILGGVVIGLGATVAVLKDFNKVIPEVKKQFADLQDQMSEKFWAIAEKPIRHMIDNLFPELSAGLQQTSSDLGTFFGNLSTSFTGALNNDLAMMFDGLAQSIAIASRHTDAFAGIIATLGSLGAAQLPRLAGWFGDISEQFNTFLNKAAKDGSLQEWVDNGITQLKALGSLLHGIGSTLSGIAKAATAAGGSTLQMAADTMNGVAEVVNGTTFQDNLTGVLSAAHDMMSRISNGSGAAFEDFMLRLSSLFQDIAPIAGDTIGAAFGGIFAALSQVEVSDGIIKMFEGLQAAVSGLLPALDPVGVALGAVAAVIGALAANLGPSVGAALAAVAPVVAQVADALVPVVNMLGPIVQSIIKAAVPLVQQLGDALLSIVDAAKPLIAKVGELVNLLLPVLVPVLSIVIEIIRTALVGAINGATKIIGGIITVFTGVIDFFKAVFHGEWGAALDAIVDILKGVFDIIVGAIQVWLNVGILGFLRGGFIKLLSLFKGSGAKMVSIIKSAVDFIGRIWKAAWNGIKTILSKAWQGIWWVIKSALTGVWNFIKLYVTGWVTFFKIIWEMIGKRFLTGVSKVIGFVKKLPGKIIGIFTGAATLLTDAGADVINGLIEGIKSTGGKLKEFLTDWIDEHVPGPVKKILGIHSPSRVFMEIGKFVGEGFALGIAGSTKSVDRKMERLLELVTKTSDKGLINLVTQTRSKLAKLAEAYEGVDEKIRERITSITDAARDAGNSVRDALIAASDFTSLEDKSFGSISEFLAAQAEKAREFAKALKSLKDLGLNATSFLQIANAGPDALDYANSIATAGAAGVSELNSLQAEIDKWAKKSGATVREVMLENGMNMAKGLLQGLRDQRSKIEDEMTAIAQAMVKVIKTELGIHSPSRVFRDLGANVSRGMVLGIESVDIEPPKIGPLPKSRIGSAVDRALLGNTASTSKTINYYAAPGSSLGSEEDLFAALDRARGRHW